MLTTITNIIIIAYATRAHTLRVGKAIKSEAEATRKKAPTDTRNEIVKTERKILKKENIPIDAH